MKLLLDTKALIWVLTAPERLSAAAADAIRDAENRVFISVISAWELGILRSKGRVRMPADLESQLVEKNFDPLPVRMSHAMAIDSLPSFHADPFDRMLVAQAQVEALTLVTSDRMIRRYPVATLSAL